MTWTDRNVVHAKMGQLRFDASMAVINGLLRLPGHWWRYPMLRRMCGVSLGRDVSIARGIRLTVRGGVSIGDRTIINDRVLLDGRGGLSIGRDVNISPSVTIWTAEHDPASPSFAGRVRAVDIRDRAWVASSAIVLPGSTVGVASIVGAGTVAHGWIDDHTIVAGNPARVIGRRADDAQLRLEKYRRFFQ